MLRYHIQGLYGYAAAQRLQQAVAAVPGVARAELGIFAAELQLYPAEGAAPDEAAIRQAVADAGCAVLAPEQAATWDAAAFRRWLGCAAVLLAALFCLDYAALLPAPAPLHSDAALAVCAVLALPLTLLLWRLCRPVWQSAQHSIRARQPDPDALVCLAALLCFGCGLAGIVARVAALAAGAAAPRPAAGFANSGALLCVTMLLRFVIDAARARLAVPPPTTALPETALRVQGSEPQTVAASQLKPGDLFLVRPGDVLPADGVVLAGVSSVQETALTGAADPVEKFPGSFVLAASCNQTGALTCRAMHTGSDTALYRLRSAQHHAAVTHSAALPRMEALCRHAAPVLGASAVVYGIFWLALTRSPAAALLHAAALAVAMNPNTLCLAMQAAAQHAGLHALRHSVLFCHADALYHAADARSVLLEQSAAISAGEPTVVEVTGIRRVPEQFLLSMAAGLELCSDDPVAQAILRRAEQDQIKYASVTGLRVVPGQGVYGKAAGKILAGGSAEFLAQYCPLPPELVQRGEAMRQRDITPMYFSLAGSPAGVIGVSNVVRHTTAPALARLQAQGVQVYLLANPGDNTALHIAAQVGVPNERLLDTPPEVATLARVSVDGCTGPADLHIALFTGSDPVPQDADVLLLRGDLADLPLVWQCSRSAAATAAQVRRAAWCAAALGVPVALLLPPAAVALWGLAAQAALLALALHTPREAAAPAPQPAPPRETVAAGHP